MPHAPFSSLQALNLTMAEAISRRQRQRAAEEKQEEEQQQAAEEEREAERQRARAAEEEEGAPPAAGPPPAGPPLTPEGHASTPQTSLLGGGSVEPPLMGLCSGVKGKKGEGVRKMGESPRKIPK